MADTTRAVPPSAAERKTGTGSQSLLAQLRQASEGKLAIIVLPVATAIFAGILWELFATYGSLPKAILPAPSDVAEKLFKHGDLILDHAFQTTYETILAFVISIPLGVALAAWMTYSKLAHWSLYPNLVVFQLIPKIALAPLFIVWLGIGTESRVTFSIFICFFPILVSTTTGLLAVDRDMVKLCRALEATKLQILLHVRFPYSIPYIFSGMKVSVTLAIIGVVVGEFIASNEGLGYLILFASSRQQTDMSLAAIGVLCVVGLGLYGLVAVADLLLSRKYESR